MSSHLRKRVLAASGAALLLSPAAGHQRSSGAATVRPGGALRRHVLASSRQPAALRRRRHCIVVGTLPAIILLRSLRLDSGTRRSKWGARILDITAAASEGRRAPSPGTSRRFRFFCLRSPVCSQAGSRAAAGPGPTCGGFFLLDGGALAAAPLRRAVAELTAAGAAWRRVSQHDLGLDRRPAAIRGCRLATDRFPA